MVLNLPLKKIKEVTASGLYYAGFFDFLRFLQRKRVTILMYHRFSKSREPFKLSQKTFYKQLVYLNARYNIIRFSEYIKILYGESFSLPPNPLIITIDDGYQDNYEYAFPVLKELNVPATIFLTTDFISNKAWLWPNRLEYILRNSSKPQFVFRIRDREVSFRVDNFSSWHKTQLSLFAYCRSLQEKHKKEVLDELADYLGVIVPEQSTAEFAPMSWGQINEMSKYGIEYGSHTCTHPIMSQLTSEEVFYELNASKRIIEENISNSIDVFCYPNGQPQDVSQAVVKRVQSVGYRAAVSTVYGFNSLNFSDPFWLKRIALGAASHPFPLARLMTATKNQI